MSKPETPKLWQQVENKRVRNTFKSISHFSDTCLLSKLLSPDKIETIHTKTPDQFLKQKTTKDGELSLTIPDWKQIVAFLSSSQLSPSPPWILYLLLWVRTSWIFFFRTDLRVLKDLQLFPILCCSGTSCKSFSNHYRIFSVQAGILACQI